MVGDARSDKLEPGGLRTGWVTVFAGGFLLLLFGSLAVFYAIFVTATPRDRTPPPHEFPPPRLESNPAVELHALLDKQRKELSDYRWANADHTVLAIPIDRAMAIIAARGEKAFASIAGVESAADKPAGDKP
jgi:hypothetical protein